MSERYYRITFASKDTGEKLSAISFAPDEIDAVKFARRQLNLSDRWIADKVIIPKLLETSEPGGLRVLYYQMKGAVVSSLGFIESPQLISVTSMGTLESEERRGFMTALWVYLLNKGKPVAVRGLTKAGESFMESLKKKGYGVKAKRTPQGLVEYIVVSKTLTRMTKDPYK